jgi:hypothetical protein
MLRVGRCCAQCEDSRSLTVVKTPKNAVQLQTNFESKVRRGWLWMLYCIDQAVCRAFKKARNISLRNLLIHVSSRHIRQKVFIRQNTVALVPLLHCPRLSQYDCCLPFPCIHAQTMQHCQHPHTASNFSNLTWAGQQSATL